MRCNTFLILTAFILIGSSPSLAEESFNSSKKLNADAQTIRLKAVDIGWKIGKTASLAAASIIKGKTELYPKDNIDICIREVGGIAAEGIPALVGLITIIASHFGVTVSQKAAASAVPVIGGAGGALINSILMDHFQNTASKHFIIRG